MTDAMSGLLDAALGGRASAALLRRRIPWAHIDATHIRDRDGRTLLNFSSNNYLGLTHHPRMLQVLQGMTATGAGAAGLISGQTQIHADAESALASWKHTEAAILMPSGYQANIAAIQTLTAAAAAAGRGVRFLVDKLAHASLIDAVRQHGVAYRVFPHNNLERLGRLLTSAPADEVQVVLTESIFSMDGHAADLRGLAELKRRMPFVLFVDEAHGSGVYGEGGAGLVNELGLSSSVDISVVTLSKAMGVSGGAICGTAKFISAVENFGRAFIYSTAVSPLIARLAQEAIAVCRDEPGLQASVRQHAQRVREALSISSGMQDSPIIPIIVGEAARAIDAAARLMERGILVVAVRPPTVPPGTSRLRMTVSAAHTQDDISQLLEALKATVQMNCRQA